MKSTEKMTMVTMLVLEMVEDMDDRNHAITEKAKKPNETRWQTIIPPKAPIIANGLKVRKLLNEIIKELRNV